MSERWKWRTVRIEWTKHGTPNGEEWKHAESVEMRYRPDDLGSIARATKPLEAAFLSALLSPTPFRVTVTDDEVEAP